MSIIELRRFKLVLISKFVQVAYILHLSD